MGDLGRGFGAPLLTGFGGTYSCQQMAFGAVGGGDHWPKRGLMQSANSGHGSKLVGPVQNLPLPCPLNLPRPALSLSMFSCPHPPLLHPILRPHSRKNDGWPTAGEIAVRIFRAAPSSICGTRSRFTPRKDRLSIPSLQGG